MAPVLLAKPIGYIVAEKARKFDAPHQPDSESAERNIVRLEPGRQFDLALEDLAGFEWIWLVFWFHRNSDWRPRVMPPRGPAKRRGVFATRAPHRPNPIGLTSVPLIAIEGLDLIVGPLDLVDGTPILDIKPYIPRIDSHPGAKAGWVDELEAPGGKWMISSSPLATEQFAWLAAHGVDFRERAFQQLQDDPFPHRTRRILRLKSGELRMSCGPWRIFYVLEGDVIQILCLSHGYANETLNAEGWEKIPDHAALRAWPWSSRSA